MNYEGFSDPTAEKAINAADRTPQDVIDLVHMMRALASICGYDIASRIHFRDRKTGREWD
jgi:hypothetical protein